MVLEVYGLDDPSAPWLSPVTELVDLAWPYGVCRLGLASERSFSLFREGVLGLSFDSGGCTVASLWLEPGR